MSAKDNHSRRSCRSRTRAASVVGDGRKRRYHRGYRLWAEIRRNEKQMMKKLAEIMTPAWVQKFFDWAWGRL